MRFFRKRKSQGEFEALALPHLGSLHRTARRVLGDSSQADDVVQEVYLRAWRSFDRLQPDSNHRAWLFKILLNCVRDHRRRWMRGAVADNSEAILESRAAPVEVRRRLTDEEMLAALERLPPQSRQILWLADVEGFAYHEIAGLLEIRIGTVMSRLSRARKKLRRALDGSSLVERREPSRFADRTSRASA